jgi:hypothetical protein
MNSEPEECSSIIDQLKIYYIIKDLNNLQYETKKYDERNI